MKYCKRLYLGLMSFLVYICGLITLKPSLPHKKNLEYLSSYRVHRLTPKSTYTTAMIDRSVYTIFFLICSNQVLWWTFQNRNVKAWFKCHRVLYVLLKIKMFWYFVLHSRLHIGQNARTYTTTNGIFNLQSTHNIRKLDP